MRERIIIVFIAIAIGLLITTLMYFLYQQTKIAPHRPQNFDVKLEPTKGPENGPLLLVDTPKNNSLSDKRSIQVKGKTDSKNTLIVSTNQEDVITTPTSDGSFSVTITIDTGANRVITSAISPDGTETKDSRVVTFSTEDF